MKSSDLTVNTAQTQPTNLFTPPTRLLQLVICTIFLSGFFAPAVWAQHEKTYPQDERLNSCKDSIVVKNTAYAESCLKALLPVFKTEKDWISLADSYRLLAFIELGRKKWTKLEGYVSQVVELHKAHQLDPSQVLAEAYVYRAFSEKNHHADIQQSIAAIQLTIEIYTKLKDTLRLGHYYTIQAGQYQESNQPNKAIETYHAALNLLQEKLGPINQKVLDLYGYIGYVYQEMGDTNLALDFYKQQFKLAWKAVEAAPVQEKLTKQTYISYVCNPKLGNIYFQMGDYGQASYYYQKTSKGSARHYVYKGNIERVAGKIENYRKALYYYAQSDSVAHHYAKGQLLHLPPLYMQVADLYKEMRRFDSALLYLQMAVDTFETYQSKEKGHFQADAWLIAGEIHTAKGDFVLARQYLDSSRVLFRDIYGNSNSNVASVYASLGASYEEEGKYVQALNAYQQSLQAISPSFQGNDWASNPSIKDIQAHVSCLNALDAKAHLLQRLYYEKEANISYLKASLSTSLLVLDLIDTMRISFLNQESKKLLIKEATPIFEEGLHTALQLKELTGDAQYLEQAFAFAEKSKAFMLLEGLREAQAIQYANIPPELLEEERKLKIELAYYQRKYHDFITNKANKDNHEIAESYWPIRKKREAYNTLIEKLEKEYPEYYRHKYDLKHASIADIQQRLPDAQTAVIEYFLGDKTLYTFAITQSHVKVSQIADVDSIDQLLDKLIRPLRDAESNYKRTQNWIQLTADLYQILLHPVLSRLPEEVDKLIIIPDGKLGYLPFDILMTEAASVANSTPIRSLPYLIRTHQVRYGYSATTLFIHPTRIRLLPFQWRSLAGFAPTYDSDLALTFNDEEVHHINQLLDGDVFVGNIATENLFKFKAPDYPVLHLALHGFLDSEQPLNSRLVFSPTPGDTTEDSYLHAYELYNMQLRTQLAVLSACQTGYGPIARGEGIISLARAFRFAGCPSIVMSLWEADGSVSKDLMYQFYAHLTDGMDKDAALRQAKLDYLATAPPNRIFPHYWSNFVLIGDAQPLKQPLSPWIWLGIALLGISLLSIWIWLGKK